MLFLDYRIGTFLNTFSTCYTFFQYVHCPLWHCHVKSIQNDVGIALGAVTLAGSSDANGVLSSGLQSRHLDFELPPSQLQVGRTFRHDEICKRKRNVNAADQLEEG